MIVRKIALNGWRNYEFAAAEFSPGTNVITGENAQGKTNLLEAVYLLTGGKSFRTRFDKNSSASAIRARRCSRMCSPSGGSRPCASCSGRAAQADLAKRREETAAELAGTFAAVLFLSG